MNRPTTRTIHLGAALALLVAQGCGSTPSATPDAGRSPDVQAVDVPPSPMDVPSIDTPVSPPDVPTAPIDAPPPPPDVPPPPDAGPPVVGEECSFDAQCLLDSVGLVCDRALGRCVECVASADCEGRGFCNERRQCVDGCRRDDDCLRAQYCSPGGTCEYGCRSDESCPLSIQPHCDPGSRGCVACVTDAHCGAGRICRGGSCTAGCSATSPCAAGSTCCDGLCQNLQTDPAHCGTCANRCSSSTGGVATCTAGVCGGTCMTGLGNCDGNAANGCETDTRTSVAHCGACNNACPAPAGGAAACSAGTCGIACAAGRGNCDGNAANGCEATLDTTANCGACGRACAPANGTGACTAGACAVTSCATNFANCDGSAANGCEVDTRTSLTHCGMCNRACSFANAAATCAAGACAMGACNAGFADCDGNPANGCEVDTRTSLTHCGMCNRACTAANGTATCAAGACGVGSCSAGYANCDGDATNGCEVATANNVQHCGACGTACPANGTCSGGTCACPFGTTMCGATCASLGRDTANCGSCGRACAAGQVCSGGNCVASCSSGATACAGGCTLLGEDRNNCGACGTVCGAESLCASGRCVAVMSIDGGGCADGTREAFTDRTRFTRIAGCSGSWALPGIFPAIPASASPSCATLGNNSTASPAGCASSNLCAPGWHICNGGEVLPRTENMGCTAGDYAASSFFAAAVSGTGCGRCALRSNTGTAGGSTISCATCREDGNLNNDFFGCGTIGSTGVAGSCDGLNRFSEDQCTALGPSWSCPSMGGESRTVVKSSNANGGVLCCRD